MGPRRRPPRCTYESRKRSQLRTASIVILLCGSSVAGISQTTVEFGVTDKFGMTDKLVYHATRGFSPSSIAMSGVAAGYSQMTNSPAEWGQGGAGYSRRLASSVASGGVRAVLAFGLDSALHQDPRYFRSDGGGFWPRLGHAMRGTILTQTDSGGETLATWRLGSAYGAAYIVEEWYPDRFHTLRHGFVSGSTRLGFDAARNVLAEFGPDIIRKVLRRKS
jgi:hypothetical protein